MSKPENLVAPAGGTPPLPRSAASFGLNACALAAGIATVFGLLKWYIGAGHSNYLLVAMVACSVVFAVIGLGELAWLRPQNNPSSGLAGEALRPVDFGRVAVRLAGFALTLGIIALAYWIFPEYHGSFYDPYWGFLETLAIPVLPLVPFYFAWTDRRLQDPHDAYWHLGMLALRSGSVDIDWAALRSHFMGWAVKCFFLPLMAVYLSGEVHTLNNVFTALSRDGMAIYHFLYELSYTVDLLFCVVGYTITLRLFDSHIRSTEPTAFGWVIALVCYQPFYSVIGSYYLHYDDSIYWDNWGILSAWPPLRYLWAAAIIALLFIYGLSTVAFGLRFSNLTYRGIITAGPYRFTKHPAYLSKNLSWWLISVPWVWEAHWYEAVRNCCMLALLNLVYYLRARTEESHLSLRDPDYVAYALWMEEHGLLRRLGRLLPVLRYRPPATTANTKAAVARN
ncbi:MAG: isoprenylcysteine carboxylmethyltransferase family protein [Nevskia sp.]|nr:isoprenylcysteine carboxylmethyltransferase family protein [Nevskia sp.]